MVLQDFGRGTQRVRDELGSEPTTHEIVKVKAENAILPSVNMRDVQDTIGNSWIVGSSTNGIVGANTSTQGGGQQVVGASGRVETVVRVINHADTYFEIFNYTTFKDTGNTTATWSGDGTVSFTNTEVAQSLAVYKDETTINNVVVSLNVTSGSIGDLSIDMSADGGSNYERVQPGIKHNFAATGTEIRWKITATGTVTIDRLKIQYNVTDESGYATGTGDGGGSTGPPPETFPYTFPITLN